MIFDCVIYDVFKGSRSNKRPVNMSINREAVIALYAARLFLPGFFARRFLLLVPIILPLVDMATDWINAGNDK